MSATADAAAPAKDALYDHGAIDLSERSDASSEDDVVGTAPPPPAAAAAASQPRNPAPAASAAPRPDLVATQLHEDETRPPTEPPMVAASTAQTAPSSPHASSGAESGGTCCQCGRTIGSTKAAVTKDGPLHPQCIAEYKFLHQPRCRYCNIRFHDDEVDSFVKDPETGHLYHPDCRTRAEAGKPFVQPTKEGEVRKFAIARSKLSRHNWKSRYFVLSPANGGIRYYADKTAATAGGSDSKKGDAASDGSASYDADADPDREANETRRSKGVVPLTNRSRLLTRPNMSNYKPSSSSASDNDIGIIFFASAEDQRELRLIFQCDSVEERAAWIRALEAYIYTVDDPSDYSNAKAALQEREKAREEEMRRAKEEERKKEEKEEKKREKEKEKEQKKK